MSGAREPAPPLARNDGIISNLSAATLGVRHAHGLSLRSRIVGASAAAGAGARGLAGLAAGDARKSAFGYPRPRDPHRQAVPALRRCHGLWRADPLALR